MGLDLDLTLFCDDHEGVAYIRDLHCSSTKDAVSPTTGALLQAAQSALGPGWQSAVP